MERTETNQEEVLVINNLDELLREDSAPVLELTDNDLYLELCVKQGKYGPQLLARLGDGKETDPIQYIDQYVSEAAEEGRAIPHTVRSAILIHASAIYNHYGPDHAKRIIERVF